MRGGINKPIVLVSLEYGGARLYPSVKMASEALGVYAGRVSEALKENKDIMGFKPMYLQDYKRTIELEE